MRYITFLLPLLSSIPNVYCQLDSNRKLMDTIKITHANPLYVDLIGDLGAKKGENAINLGFEIAPYQSYVAFSGFVEYEFVVAKRLGLELELPFSFYQPINGASASNIPGGRLNGIKSAIQYTFWVSPKAKLSLAIGYLNHLEINEFRNISSSANFLLGNVYNPFFVVAKRFGNFNTLLYMGPYMEHNFINAGLNTTFNSNLSIYYVFKKSNHFLGLEANHKFSFQTWELILRPQARFNISKFSLGMSLGIPINIPMAGVQYFIRMGYDFSPVRSKK